VNFRNKAESAAIIFFFSASSGYRNSGERQDDRIYRMKPGWPFSGLSFLNPVHPVHPVNSYGNGSCANSRNIIAATPLSRVWQIKTLHLHLAVHLRAKVFSFPLVMCLPNPVHPVNSFPKPQRRTG
jgi:hypothetical protein